MYLLCGYARSLLAGRWSNLTWNPPVSEFRFEKSHVSLCQIKETQIIPESLNVGGGGRCKHAAEHNYSEMCRVRMCKVQIMGGKKVSAGIL